MSFSKKQLKDALNDPRSAMNIIDKIEKKIGRMSSTLQINRESKLADNKEVFRKRAIAQILKQNLPTSKAKHIPGMNYCGPGTPIILNILNDVKPVNKVDAVCRQHDIDYVQANNQEEVVEADKRMLNSLNKISPSNMAKFSTILQGIAGYTGIAGKSILENIGTNLGVISVSPFIHKRNIEPHLIDSFKKKISVDVIMPPTKLTKQRDVSKVTKRVKDYFNSVGYKKIISGLDLASSIATPSKPGLADKAILNLVTQLVKENKSFKIITKKVKDTINKIELRTSTHPLTKRDSIPSVLLKNFDEYFLSNSYKKIEKKIDAMFDKLPGGEQEVRSNEIKDLVKTMLQRNEPYTKITKEISKKFGIFSSRTSKTPSKVGNSSPTKETDSDKYFNSKPYKKIEDKLRIALDKLPQDDKDKLELGIEKLVKFRKSQKMSNAKITTEIKHMTGLTKKRAKAEGPGGPRDSTINIEEKPERKEEKPERKETKPLANIQSLVEARGLQEIESLLKQIDPSINTNDAFIVISNVNAIKQTNRFGDIFSGIIRQSSTPESESEILRRVVQLLKQDVQVDTLISRLDSIIESSNLEDEIKTPGKPEDLEKKGGRFGEEDILLDTKGGLTGQGEDGEDEEDPAKKTKTKDDSSKLRETLENIDTSIKQLLTGRTNEPRQYRPFIIQGGAELVAETPEEEAEDANFLANYSWIDDGDFYPDTGRNSSLYISQKFQDRLRFREPLQMPDAGRPRTFLISEARRQKFGIKMIPDVQRKQAPIRDTQRSTRGTEIKLYPTGVSNNYVLPKNYARSNRLIYPNTIDRRQL